MNIPVAREGFRYILLSAAAGVVLLYLWPVYSIVPFALAGYITFFFRDPRRVAKCDDSAIVAPADGKIVRIDEVSERDYLGSRVRRVSIFLSIFNVHINYAPVSGVVDYMHYRRGSFKSAMRNISSEVNENNTIGIKNGVKTMTIRQIAGLIARRIVCRCVVGDRVCVGEKIGMIKFGSRVDVFLPARARLLVEHGDRVKGGETVIARVE